jgi:hypothetical protein
VRARTTAACSPDMDLGLPPPAAATLASRQPSTVPVPQPDWSRTAQLVRGRRALADAVGPKPSGRSHRSTQHRPLHIRKSPCRNIDRLDAHEDANRGGGRPAQKSAAAHCRRQVSARPHSAASRLIETHTPRENIRPLNGTAGARREVSAKDGWGEGYREPMSCGEGRQKSTHSKCSKCIPVRLREINLSPRTAVRPGTHTLGLDTTY